MTFEKVIQHIQRFSHFQNVGTPRLRVVHTGTFQTNSVSRIIALSGRPVRDCHHAQPDSSLQTVGRSILSLMPPTILDNLSRLLS